MPSSRATWLILLPLVFTKRTASNLNSFVNVRCPFGMMPSLWRLSSKFISSGKVSQCHRSRETGDRIMLDADKTVLITGATGQQGGAVIRHMLAKGWNLRALTRNPSSDTALSLASQGVELVQG